MMDGCFSPASRIILIERIANNASDDWVASSFSPASRIILIERPRYRVINR